MNSAGHAMMATAIGIAIFVGLPLVGWGLSDVAILVPPAGRRPGEEDKRVRRQRLAIVLLQIVSLALVVVAPYADRRGIAVLPAPALRVLGLALFVLGQVAVSGAQIALDRQFSGRGHDPEGPPARDRRRVPVPPPPPVPRHRRVHARLRARLPLRRRARARARRDVRPPLAHR